MTEDEDESKVHSARWPVRSHIQYTLLVGLGDTTIILITITHQIISISILS